MTTTYHASCLGRRRLSSDMAGLGGGMLDKQGAPAAEARMCCLRTGWRDAWSTLPVFQAVNNDMVLLLFAFPE